jgi:uncharacterized membrane protein
MKQTFSDLYNKKQNKRSFSFVLWIFVETTIGIAKEHVFLITEMNMKSIMTNPKSAALISFLLALPIGLIYLVFMSDVESLTQILNQWFTVTGEGGDINMLGRIVMFGGLLFLPIAFILNLLPILKKDELNGIRVLHKVNLAVGAVILLLILFTWGGLILESIYCAQGIRCD